MNKFRAYLNKPASINHKPWIIVIVASLLVCFLLGFLQPFGIVNLRPSLKLFIVAGYTAVTAISTSIIGYLFPYLFKKFYRPSTWTIGKKLINDVLIISLIALGNAIFSWGIGHHPGYSFGSILLSYFLVTVLIGIIPALVSTFIVQNNALKKNLRDAMTINAQLSERLQNEKQINRTETKTVGLSGGTKEILTLYPDNLLYLESSGNYVKVNYLDDDLVKQKQIRTTITQMEKDLQNYPYVVRCHRAYMVNVMYIVTAEGNSQGLQLTVRHLKEKIPVSRPYIHQIKNKL